MSHAFVWILLASAVLAAPRSNAANLPFHATFGFDVNGVAELTTTGVGVAVVNGSGGGGSVATLALPALAIQATDHTLDVQDPQVYPVEGLGLTVANGAGTFMGSQALIPLMGVAKICLFGPCSSAAANLSIPLSVVGQGGTVTVMGPFNHTVIGAPWTTGTAALFGYGGTPITRMGSRHGPLSGMASTASVSGVINLVTPIFISTNLSQQSIFTFARLSLHFVPEPATLGLLAAGLAVVGVIGRRRSEGG